MVSNFNININGLSKNNVSEDYKILLKEFRTANDFPNFNSYSQNLLFGTTQTFTFPEANYNSTQLTDYFNANNSLGITLAFSTQTENFTFYNTLGPTTPITITPNQYQADLLGLSVELLTIGTTLASSKPVNLNYPKKIKIVTQNLPIKSLNSTNQNSNLLDVVYPSVAFGEEIVYTNDYPINTETDQIGELNLQLIDEYNNQLVSKKTDYELKLLFMNKDD